MLVPIKTSRRSTRTNRSRDQAGDMAKTSQQEKEFLETIAKLKALNSLMQVSPHSGGSFVSE